MRNRVGTLVCLALLVAPGLAAAQTTMEEMSALLESINDQLALDGADYRVAVVEYLTAADSKEMGITVIAKSVGNKHLGHDFVPGDLRRAWSGPGATSITYAIDTTDDAEPFFGGLSGADTRTPFFQSSMRGLPPMEYMPRRNDGYSLRPPSLRAASHPVAVHRPAARLRQRHS